MMKNSTRGRGCGSGLPQDGFGAVEDLWANPEGQFRVLQAADPVYRLLGAGGLEARTMPEPGKLIDSTLGYSIRPGKHSMTRDDWKVFLDFADRQLQR